ncbi:hypothetical protein [Deinococcus koreensis]|uniref:DUF1648 domain-containing protein n=1 Tax=Deinococcus koreensis TaxID=2054903 RepID=A0A2K3V046_9DEIO|nr:hypothetical protein [Deinococcus koreensis]PNY82166.1 hypothetical protein CVO96_13015 [Deinococcus koreensis]
MFALTSATLLLAVLGWTFWFLVSAPPTVPIRMRLDDDPAPGSPWRIVIIPLAMTLVYGVLGHAERVGVVNSPSPEGYTPEEARRIAAGLRLLCMGLFVVIPLAMVAGGHWSWGEAGRNMLICMAFSVSGLLSVRVLPRRR